MKQFKSLLGLGLACLLLTACPAGTEENTSHFIPDVTVECAQGQADDCFSAASGRKVYVGFISNLNIICRTYLNGITAAAFATYFDAAGIGSVFKDGSFMVGQVQNWTDSQGVPLATVKRGNYRLCAFIDTNSDGQLDNGEPVGEGEFFVSGGLAKATIDFWEEK